MIQIQKEKIDLKKVRASEEPHSNDIFVERYSETEEIDENGVKTITPKIQRVNLTRKINETSKIINELNAEERIQILNKTLTGGNNQ